MSDENENMLDEIEPLEGIDAVQYTLDGFLATADVTAVYGEPVEHGDTIIIPAAEVLCGMGFGIGYGSGGGSAPQEKEDEDEEGSASEGYGSGGGGGGGGRTLSRPVAVVISGPEGVRIEPVVDVTKIALAALTAVGFMVGMIARMSRGEIRD
ncbi:MAG: hypothetical protein JW726_12255 [Anaerolineales bacterium]|nr:hypothetical protein [Anaerolineales bacterium]